MLKLPFRIIRHIFYGVVFVLVLWFSVEHIHAAPARLPETPCPAILSEYADWRSYHTTTGRPETVYFHQDESREHWLYALVFDLGDGALAPAFYTYERIKSRVVVNGDRQSDHPDCGWKIMSADEWVALALELEV